MINKTFGAGGTYSDPYACAVYLAGLPAIIDDYTFMQVGDCVMSGIMGDALIWFSLGGKTITFDSSVPHNGDLNLGWKIEIPINVGLEGLTLRSRGGGNFVARNLKIIAKEAGGISLVQSVTGDDGARFFFENLVVVGLNAENEIGIRIQDDNRAQIKCYNCKVYNCYYGIGNPGGASGGAGGPANKLIENCSVYGGRCGLKIIYDDTNYGRYTVKNLVCVNQGNVNGSAAFSLPVTNNYNLFANCADDDGSLPAYTTNSIENITPANEFISLSSASGDFLKLKTAGQLADGGAIPANTTKDIADIPIPDYSGWYPIGCHCADDVPPPPPDDTYQNIIIDSGAVYKNYGTETEQLIGATRGGNKFYIEQKTEDLGYDGRGANVMGGKRIAYVQPHIEANIIEVSDDLLKLSLPASEKSALTHQDKITRALQIALTDYCENIAIVGEVLGKNYPIVCIIKNALCVSSFELKTADRGESVIPLKFDGHFNADDLTTEPWEIRYPRE